MAKNTKMKKTLFIFVGATAAIILVIAIFVLTFDINRYKPRIQDNLSDALGMNAYIKGKMKLSLFPYASISLEDILLRNKDADVALAKKVEVGIRLHPLLRGDVVIERIGLDSPTFYITKDKKGEFNFETHKKRAGAFMLENISVRKGDLLYRDEASGGRSEMHKCDLAVQTLSVETGKLPNAITFDGKLSCGDARVGQLGLSDITAVIRGHGGTFEVNSLAMKVFGGDGEGKITLVLTGDRPEYVVDLAITKFHFEEVTKAFKERSSIRGEVNLRTHLQMTGRSIAEIMRTAKGDVSLKGQNLTLSGVNIDRVVEKYEESTNVSLFDIGASLVVGPLGMVLTKGYELGSLYTETQGGESVVRILNSDWKVRNGIAEAQDVAISTENNRIALKGRLDLVRERFDNVTVAVLDEKGCARFSQEMHGPFQHPQMEEATILKSIVGPMLNIYKKMDELFEGGRCKIFYAGSVKQPK